MNKKIYLIGGLVAVLVLGYLAFVANKSYVPVTETNNATVKNGEVYNLTASYVTKKINGVEQKMLAYNSSIPGPTIEVFQGDEITINFKNETDSPQLLHSHGVRMDSAYDGTHLVQKEVAPGESFAYKLKFPDPGIYWYHPHMGEVYGQGLGLYGAFVVKPKNANYFPLVNREIPIFLSDLPMDNNKVALEKDAGNYQLMGHYGNLMLTNGQENYTLQAKEGEVVRLYIVNAANARPFNFVISGTKMKLVGGDNGAYEKASFVDSVILGPSERAIVDVFFQKSGRYALQNITPSKTYTLGNVVVLSDEVAQSYQNEFNTLQSNQEVTDSIEKFKPYFTKEADKKLTLTIGMMGNMMQNMGKGMMMGGVSQKEETVNLMGMQMTMSQAKEHCQMMPNMRGCEPFLNTATTTDTHLTNGIEWEDNMSMIGQMATKQMVSWKIVDDATGKSNSDINWTFKKGQPVKIRIYNDPNSAHPMQHPIHFHGQRFLVVARNGVIETNLVWKDTTLVKTGETVDIVLDPSNVGSWMAHCHISEHLENGMMFLFKVEE